MLVRRLLAEILLDTATSRSQRVASVQDVDDNVGGIQHTVQLVPDTLALTLVEDGLDRQGDVTLVLVRTTRLAAEQLVPLLELIELVKVLVDLASQIRNGTGANLDALPLRLGTERVSKGGRLDRHLGLVLLDTVDVVGTILDQGHGQLVALEQDRVRVRGLLCHGAPERRQALLGDDTGVTEPLAVGLDPGVGDFSALEGSGLGDLAVGVALRLAILVHVQLPHPLGRAVDIAASAICSQISSQGRLGNLPVEIFALDLDIAHAIAGLALANLSARLFLAGSHLL